MSNDDIKSQMYSKASAFIRGVDPYLLIQPLIEEKVITQEEWQEIEKEYETKRQKCQELYNYLKRSQHPRAFLVVKETLEQHGHPFRNELENLPSTSNDGADKHSAGNNDQLQQNISSLQEDAGKLVQERDEARGQLKELKERLEVVETESKQRLEQLTAFKRRLKTVESQLQSGTGKRTNDGSDAVTKKRRINAPDLILSKNTFAMSDVFVLAVAKSDQYIFILCGYKSGERYMYAIRAYEDHSEFHLVDEIPLNELSKDPSDLVYCDKSKCLYFIEYDVIWVVKLTEHAMNDSRVEQWLRCTDGEFRRVWFHDDHLLVFIDCKDDPKIEIYDVSNASSLIRRFQFPDDIKCEYIGDVIGKPNGQFVIFHDTSFKEELTITLLDSDGKVTARCKTPKKLELHPICAASLDSRENRLFVRDELGTTVHIFDADSLKFVATLLDENDLPPNSSIQHFCFDEKKRQLITGFADRIGVYEIR